MIKKIINLVKNFFIKFKMDKEFKDRLIEMEKQDPFEYWSEEEWDRNKLEVPKIKKGDIK